MRSALASMQEIANLLFKGQSLVPVESRVAPLAEVFRIQGEAELAEAEKRYLPGKSRSRPAAADLDARNGGPAPNSRNGHGIRHDSVSRVPA
jgi:hypothetical protein